MRDALLSLGMPEWQVDGLIEDYAHYRRGEASGISTSVEDATSFRPPSFLAFTRDYKAGVFAVNPSLPNSSILQWLLSTEGLPHSVCPKIKRAGKEF